MSAVVRWFWSQLPKRKMVIRAALCGVMGTLPLLFAATVQRWYVVLPLLAMIGMGVYKSGVGEDVRKQLRWMSRMSQRGPVFSLLRLVGRLYVRGKRRLYGDALDVLPLPPSVVGPSVRSTNAVMLKWLVKPHSAYSVERYEVQLRPKAGAAADWQQLAAALEEAKHAAGGLVPDTEYLVRVRAHNSKGKSEWCEAGFRRSRSRWTAAASGRATRGRRAAGGRGAHRDIALPAARAKQLSVSVMPTKLSLLPPPAARRAAAAAGRRALRGGAGGRVERRWSTRRRARAARRAARAASSSSCRCSRRSRRAPSGRASCAATPRWRRAA